MPITQDDLNDIRMAVAILDNPGNFQLDTLALCAANLRKVVRRIEREQANEPESTPRQSPISPSEIQKRLTSWQHVAQAIAAGLDGKPFQWTAGEFDAYRVKAAAMGITLVSKSKLERDGYRLRRGAKPVGSGYFKAPISREADLYVLECQAAKVEEGN